MNRVRSTSGSRKTAPCLLAAGQGRSSLHNGTPSTRRLSRTSCAVASRLPICVIRADRAAAKPSTRSRHGRLSWSNADRMPTHLMTHQVSREVQSKLLTEISSAALLPGGLPQATWGLRHVRIGRYQGTSAALMSSRRARERYTAGATTREEVSHPMTPPPRRLKIKPGASRITRSGVSHVSAQFRAPTHTAGELSFRLDLFCLDLLPRP